MPFAKATRQLRALVVCLAVFCPIVPVLGMLGVAGACALDVAAVAVVVLLACAMCSSALVGTLCGAATTSPTAAAAVLGAFPPSAVVGGETKRDEIANPGFGEEGGRLRHCCVYTDYQKERRLTHHRKREKARAYLVAIAASLFG